MQSIMVHSVTGLDEWLAEELPEVRRLDHSSAGSLVLCDVSGDREWELTDDDEFDSLRA